MTTPGSKYLPEWKLSTVGIPVLRTWCNVLDAVQNDAVDFRQDDYQKTALIVFLCVFVFDFLCFCVCVFCGWMEKQCITPNIEGSMYYFKTRGPWTSS